jgi:hypothetical protein
VQFAVVVVVGKFRDGLCSLRQAFITYFKIYRIEDCSAVAIVIKSWDSTSMAETMGVCLCLRLPGIYGPPYVAIVPCNELSLNLI